MAQNGTNPAASAWPPIQQSVSWQSLLRTVRAPITVLVLSAMALLLPQQTKDMLAALEDGQVWEGTFIFVGTAVFLSFSAWFWTKALISARFGLSGEPNELIELKKQDSRIKDDSAFKAIPVGVAIFAALVWGMVILSNGILWVSFVTLFVCGGLAICLARSLGAGSRNPNLSRKFRLPGRNTTRDLVRSVLAHAPGPNLIAHFFFWGSLGLFFLSAILSFLPDRASPGIDFPGVVAMILPGPSAALFCLALVIGPLSVITFVADDWMIPDTIEGLVPWLAACCWRGCSQSLSASWRVCCCAINAGKITPTSTTISIVVGLLVALLAGLGLWRAGKVASIRRMPSCVVLEHLGKIPLGFHRPPVLLFFFLCLLTMQGFYPVHTMRAVEGPLLNRAELNEFFQSWAKHCAPANGDLRPVIVAVSGGASRAAVWGASVLQNVETISTDANRPTIFAVSSVSGGSLGVAAYMSLLGSLPAEQLCDSNTARADRVKQAGHLADATLGNDVLGPLLAGAVLVDIPRTAMIWAASAVHWIDNDYQPRGGDRAEAIERGFTTLWRGWGKSAPVVNRVDFESPYLSLFYEKGVAKPGMPIWIANGTNSNTGNRLLTVPFKMGGEGQPFFVATDVLATLGHDVPISTAINNTARFPYLEPAGALEWNTDRDNRTIIDGGYFENEGLQTAIELAKWLKQNGAAPAAAGIVSRSSCRRRPTAITP